MNGNPLLELQTYGQSIWLDFIRRDLLESGRLQELIDEDGVRGVTVNPSILDHAIRETNDYDDAIDLLLADRRPPAEIYEALAVEDVRGAADALRPAYDGSDGKHGFVSLEVSPHLARDTEGTIVEAERFAREVDRPNLLIKVPATLEGLEAIRRLTADGINVNVTLLFGLPRYRKVAAAYMAGIEERINRNEPVDRIASVASFFLSRIDVLVDPMLERLMAEGGRQGQIAAGLRGQVAVASAKVAYQIYLELFEDGRFHSSAEAGARVQRLLWASTSTKNPEYSDIKYVDTLIGPRTVNTVPMETLDAYRDHGDPAPRLTENVAEARRVLERLGEVGVDIDAVTQQLEDEGVEKFAASYDRIMEALSGRTPIRL